METVYIVCEFKPNSDKKIIAVFESGQMARDYEVILTKKEPLISYLVFSYQVLKSIPDSIPVGCTYYTEQENYQLEEEQRLAEQEEKSEEEALRNQTFVDDSDLDYERSVIEEEESRKRNNFFYED